MAQSANTSLQLKKLAKRAFHSLTICDDLSMSCAVVKPPIKPKKMVRVERNSSISTVWRFRLPCLGFSDLVALHSLPYQDICLMASVSPVYKACLHLL